MLTGHDTDSDTILGLDSGPLSERRRRSARRVRLTAL
jgi:hypothetical protein